MAWCGCPDGLPIIQHNAALTIRGRAHILLLTNMKLLLVFTAVLSSAAWSFAKHQPIVLHPGNPHYFLWRGQPTVLITSGEHYGAVLNLDFDYLTYLDELHKNGLNLTRLFVGAYAEEDRKSVV